MTVRRASRQRKSAASGFRSSGTGYCTSTSAALTNGLLNGKSPGQYKLNGVRGLLLDLVRTQLRKAQSSPGAYPSAALVSSITPDGAATFTAKMFDGLRQVRNSLKLKFAISNGTSAISDGTIVALKMWAGLMEKLFSTEDVPPRDRFASWHEIACRTISAQTHGLKGDRHFALHLREAHWRMLRC